MADKTVLKVMREIGLRCGIRRRRGHRAYSSYMGRVGETFENLPGRDFSASRPWEKLATDVTEFVQPWGKAYLAPVLDLCGNRVVSWSISLSPNMEQQEEMLAGLWVAMPEGATPLLHSDMGWQYQHSGYVGQPRSHGVRQSMSRKGNCLDNACVEGFFGHLKDEFYRGREWATFEGFRRDLEVDLTHWNLVRSAGGADVPAPGRVPAAHGGGVGLVFNVSKKWGAVHFLAGGHISAAARYGRDCREGIVPQSPDAVCQRRHGTSGADLGRTWAARLREGWPRLFPTTLEEP